MQKNITIDASPDLASPTLDQFLTLFEADRNRLYAYIYAFVTEKPAADDIFQDTTIILWKEFSRFELGTNFSKWANGVAFNRIRVYRRKNKRFLLGLSEELMESITNNTTYNDMSNNLNLHVNAITSTTSQIDGTITKDEDNIDSRWHHLQTCRSLLREADQKIYDCFYVQNLKAQDIADQTGRSIYAIRKSIHKIRKNLFDCVDKKKDKASL